MGVVDADVELVLLALRARDGLPVAYCNQVLHDPHAAHHVVGVDVQAAELLSCLVLIPALDARHLFIKAVVPVQNGGVAVGDLNRRNGVVFHSCFLEIIEDVLTTVDIPGDPVEASA